MKSIIIGGGKIGYYLLKTLSERGYGVVLVEKDENSCRRISEDINARVICGDGSDLDVLRDAGIDEAEIVAAVTGKDEENLVICEIAKAAFNIRKTIARVNNPKNISMFKALGVDQTVCSTEVIANLIEYEFDAESCRIIQTFDLGSMVLAETLIGGENRWQGRRVGELELPPECVLASVLRGEEVIYPRGDTEIREGDRGIFVTSQATLPKIKKSLQTGANRHASKKK
ncbi:MAG: TrkA family potassium uptake protein [Bacillota bacterium]|nr:TrkA family potassium uptake protein [Bacillota bacterium]